MKGAGQVTLGQLPGYRLAQAYRVMRHAMDCALRELDLTTPQWGTLARLQEGKELSGAEMARMHNLTPQTMNTILQNLEHAGLIVRAPRPEHGTVLAVRLSEAGRQRLAEATQRVDAVQQRMVSGLSEDEQGLLVELLDRCVQALKGPGQSGPDGPCVD